MVSPQKGLLRCNKCKESLPPEKFYTSSTSRSGYRYYCKACEYNRSNKEGRSEYFKKRNKGLKSEAIILAGGKCHRCNYNEFISALDFHHVYPDQKETVPAVVLRNKGIKGAWGELDKCCLLCGNCHRGYTSGEWRAEFIKRDGLGWTVGKDLSLNDNRYEYEPDNIPQSLLPSEYDKPEQLSMF